MEKGGGKRRSFLDGREAEAVGTRSARREGGGGEGRVRRAPVSLFWRRVAGGKGKREGGAVRRRSRAFEAAARSQPGRAAGASTRGALPGGFFGWEIRLWHILK